MQRARRQLMKLVEDKYYINAHPKDAAKAQFYYDC